MATGSPSEVAREVVALAGRRPPTLGAGRLVAIDGPSGSGKTTLGAEVARLTGAQVVHMDELMDGWDGMAGTAAQLRTIVAPLAAGRAGSYRRYDWHRGRFGPAVEVPPAPWLVVEGVGAGHPAVAEAVTVLVWVEVGDGEERLRRSVERDGEGMAERLRAWVREEPAFFAAQRTAERADVRVSSWAATP